MSVILGVLDQERRHVEQGQEWGETLGKTWYLAWNPKIDNGVGRVLECVSQLPQVKPHRSQATCLQVRQSFGKAHQGGDIFIGMASKRWDD